MVSAAAAWILANNPRLSADQVAEVLRRSARDIARPGWDISTGWGALDLGAAIRASTPLQDPFEPNDDIRWIDGRSGFRPDPPFLRSALRRVIRARIDVQKDPFDVYPVWVTPRGTLSIRLTPRAMGADLRLAAVGPHGARPRRARQGQAARPRLRGGHDRQPHAARREGVGRGARGPGPGALGRLHARAGAALAVSRRPRRGPGPRAAP